MTKFVKDAFFDFGDIKPNDAHNALVKLEKLGKIKHIITQNIDHLHQDAGSSSVSEVHGTANMCHCHECRKKYTKEEYLDVDVLYCECGGIVRPSFVFFGEELDSDVLNYINMITKQCDLFIIIGTSGMVAPVNKYPARAQLYGAKVMEFNMHETPYNQISDFVHTEPVEIILPKIVEMVIKDT